MDSHHDTNGYAMPPMSAPQMMNPPPQIFGAYDGLSNINMHDLSQPLFGDSTLLDESIEAKRRRIARVVCPDVHGHSAGLIDVGL